MTKRSLSPAEVRMDLGKWLLANHPPQTQAGDEWMCQCPVCGRDKLAINVRRKAYQCWVCGFSGWGPLRLIMAIEGEPEIRVRDFIAKATMGVLSSEVKPLDSKSDNSDNRLLSRDRFLPTAPIPPGTAWALTGDALAYAEKRGVPPDHAKWFGLASIHGDRSGSRADRILSGRLLIPVWDADRRFVYWVARATAENPIKAVNCPGTDKHNAWGLPFVADCATRREILLGLHLLVEGEAAIVVEGPLDAVVCGQGFVATLGASMSTEQAHLLAGSGVREAVILYDPDDAGRKGAEAVRSLLGAFMPVRIAHLPEGTDPADLGRAGCLELAAAAAGRWHVSAL